MILSDKQYAVSKSQLEKLEAALAATNNREVEQEWVRELELDAIQSQIEDIEAELFEYDSLKSGELTFAKTYALEELPNILVQARIAAGMTQTDLAEKLGMKPQQVQRYEATDYMGASLARIIEIARELGVKASGVFEGATQKKGAVFGWSDTDDIAWSEFPIKEMAARKWFDAPRKQYPVTLVKEYFLRAAGPQFASALHRKKMHSGNAPNEYALLAWQARILELARMSVDSGCLSEFKHNDEWLRELVRLTRHNDGPKRAKKLLAEHGVVLVYEKHLPGTYLDGAAMLSNEGHPVIGMTLRHDRLDNFWFVLFHELGHVFLHLFDGRRYDFFDEANGGAGDTLESEADQFALNALIPDNLWNKCLSRFALSEEAVKLDAERLGISASIIAGRIRKERNDYAILSNLVGAGALRSQLTEAHLDIDP